MLIGLLGAEKKCQSLLPSFSDRCKIIQIKDNHLNDFDLLVDLDFDEHQDFEIYEGLDEIPLVLASAKCSLRQALFINQSKRKNKIFGINALSGFLSFQKKEMSLLNKNDKDLLNDLMTNLGWQYEMLEDSVGMVSPRILYMIINEAFYTVQEGTASKEDINMGMKLGTNYPFGPFEWVEKFGIKDVYETLEALHEDTKEERYKIAPLLKQTYLQAEMV